jgi:ribose transport system ATP-binding protein
LLSEDRKREGLAQELSIADNLTLGHSAPVSRWGVLRPRQRRRLVLDWMQRLQVKAAGPDSPLSHLSGGNQQKVALARILYQDAGLLLLDEPTRGVDVRTKAEIYRLIGEQAAAGKAVVFVSSYLPELLAVCDSLGVMARGHLVDVRSVNDWTEAEVLAVAVSNPHTQHVET